jgi:hypothetical protein
MTQRIAESKPDILNSFSSLLPSCFSLVSLTNRTEQETSYPRRKTFAERQLQHHRARRESLKLRNGSLKTETEMLCGNEKSRKKI